MGTHPMVLIWLASNSSLSLQQTNTTWITYSLWVAVFLKSDSELISNTGD